MTIKDTRIRTCTECGIQFVNPNAGKRGRPPLKCGRCKGVQIRDPEDGIMEAREVISELAETRRQMGETP